MPPAKTNRSQYQCSFCEKGQSQVRRLIAGPHRVFICDECVIQCHRIISEEEPDQSHGVAEGQSKALTPKDIYSKLNEYVMAQDKAKKVLSVAVYNHYKRIWSNPKKDGVELSKSNILLIGPTGCGKTLLAQTLAKILNVPFAIADATSLTEAGYVGEDVENILLRLIQASDHDISRAEQGIIYIDEVDKISRKSYNPSITRDVSGEGVQQALLKIIEGCVANVSPQGGRKHPHQDFLQIKTDNILFICGGTFDGLHEIVDRRVSKSQRGIGFKARIKSGDGSPEEDKLLHLVNSDDLLQYGFIPEFVGRMPIMVALDNLDKEALVTVLTEPKNAVVKQYQGLLGMDDVELIFTQDALDAAAEEAMKRKSGARALRAIIEDVLLGVMYELPSLKTISKCIIDGDVIHGLKSPTLLTDTGDIIQLPVVEERSA